MIEQAEPVEMSSRAEEAEVFWRSKFLVGILLAFTLVLRIVTLYPDVAHPRSMLNDDILHDAAIKSASDAMARGESPLDGWEGSIAVGYPFLRQYQPLAHVTAAVIHRALGGRVEIPWIRKILMALALTALPFAIYRCARDLGLDRVGAGFTAAISPLLEAPLLLGLTDQSYVWRGFGLWSQSLATVPFVLSIGATSRALESGRGMVRAGLLIGLTLITHFIYGWLAGVIVLTFAVFVDPPRLEWKPVLERVYRTAVIGLVSGATSAFIGLPALLTSAYANISAIEPKEKWEGYGIDKLIGWFGEGRLLDGDKDAMHATRIPVVSILAAVGLVALLVGPRLGRRCATCGVPGGVDLVDRRPGRRTLALLVVSFLLLAGRITFGRLIDYIPVAPHLHLQRMIAGVHLAAMLLAGLLVSSIARRTGALRSWLGLLLLGCAITVTLAPLVAERVEFDDENGRMAVTAEEAEYGLPGEGEGAQDAMRLLERMRALPHGRVYAGHQQKPMFHYKFKGGVPLDAITVKYGFPTLGHLWHPFALASDLYYFEMNPGKAEDADLFACRYLLLAATVPAPPDANEIARDGRFVLYERPECTWFTLASAPRRINAPPSEAYDLIKRWFRGEGGERAHGVMPLLALAGEQWPPVGPESRPLRGRIVKEEVLGDGRFQAVASVDEPGYVVLKIGYHPALGATVDGEPVPLACAVPGFPAVRLDPGTHSVRIFVKPCRWRWAVLLAGALLVALIAWIERMRHPKRTLAEALRAL